jgi:hypothetical protein
MGEAGMPRELGSLIVPRPGSVVVTGAVFEPYRLLDAGGGVVGPVTAFLLDLQAC